MRRLAEELGGILQRVFRLHVLTMSGMHKVDEPHLLTRVDSRKDTLAGEAQEIFKVFLGLMLRRQRSSDTTHLKKIGSSVESLVTACPGVCLEPNLGTVDTESGTATVL